MKKRKNPFFPLPPLEPIGTLRQRVRERGVRLNLNMREKIIGYTHPFFEARFTPLKGKRSLEPAIVPWMPFGDDGPSLPIKIDPRISNERIANAIDILLPRGKLSRSLLSFIDARRATIRSRRYAYWSKGNRMGGWFELLLFPEFVPEWPEAE